METSLGPLEQLGDDGPCSRSWMFVPDPLPQLVDIGYRLENIFVEIHWLINETRSIIIGPVLVAPNRVRQKCRDIILALSNLDNEFAQQSPFQPAASLETPGLQLDSAGKSRIYWYPSSGMIFRLPRSRRRCAL
jgi:hypothetical protein